MGLRIRHCSCGTFLAMTNLQPTVIGEIWDVDKLHEGNAVEAVRVSCREAIEKSELQVWSDMFGRSNVGPWSSIDRLTLDLEGGSDSIRCKS